jgi:hypothetical protein
MSAHFEGREPVSHWGAHQAMYDKSETYSVEGANADLLYYRMRM